MTIKEFQSKNPSAILKAIKEDASNSFISINENLDFKEKKIIAIKDIHVESNKITTAGSKILREFHAPYDSTVVNNLKKNNYHIIGRTNMDEFAMGFSNKTSYFGMVDNSINSEYIAGGSSGGSAAAVAKGLVPIATGTDTGGSVRQPASFNGIYGMKPTYGLISRFGTIAFASSFDTVGVLSNDLMDNARLLEDLVSNDENDQTNYMPQNFEATSQFEKPIQGLKFCYIKEWKDKIENTEVGKALDILIKNLKKDGITVEEVSVKLIDYAFELYLILAYGEASSNLSRYDGIRFGLLNDTGEYKHYRSNFGKEVKKRLLIGGYVTSHEDSHAYLLQAQKMRRQIKEEFNDIFQKYDLIIGPTTIESALKKNEDLSAKNGYLSDYFLIPANLTGVPSMSIPFITNEEGLPIGMQILANKYQEKIIYQFANWMKGQKYD